MVILFRGGKRIGQWPRLPSGTVNRCGERGLLIGGSTGKLFNPSLLSRFIFTVEIILDALLLL